MGNKTGGQRPVSLILQVALLMAIVHVNHVACNVSYPTASRETKDSTTEKFGLSHSDPYRWMENTSSQQCQQYFQQQNELTDQVLESTSRQQIEDDLTQAISQVSQVSLPQKQGGSYMYQRTFGLNHNALYVQQISQAQQDCQDCDFQPLQFNSPTERPISVLNLKNWSDKTLKNFSLSKNGSTIWATIKDNVPFTQRTVFVDVKSQTMYPTALQNAQHLTWSSDNSGVFYIRESQFLNTVHLQFHNFGQKQSEDKLILRRSGAQLGKVSRIVITDDNQHLLIESSKQLIVCPLKSSTPECYTLITHVDSLGKFSYVTSHGESMIFYTNKQSPRGRLVSIKWTGSSTSQIQLKSEELVSEPSNQNTILFEAFVARQNILVLHFLENSSSKLEVRNMQNSWRHELFRSVGSAVNVSCDKSSDEMFVEVSSLNRPSDIYSIDLQNVEQQQQSQMHQQKIQSRLIHSVKFPQLSTENMVVEQRLIKTSDGVVLPVHMLYRSQHDMSQTSHDKHTMDIMDRTVQTSYQQNGKLNTNIQNEHHKSQGPTYTIMTGNGSMGIPKMPVFSMSAAYWVQKFNGVYAIVGVRGGGEYGNEWHKSGMRHNKQNTFSDFETAAINLIQTQITTPSMLAIHGQGSGGGLLAATVVNQMPELFKVAVIQSPLTDMLRYDVIDKNSQLMSEYGNPQVEQDVFNMISYSPLQNIKKSESSKYPSILVLTETDETASSCGNQIPSIAHSLKYIAELQHQVGKESLQERPIILQTQTQEDLSRQSCAMLRIHQAADGLCFLAQKMGLLGKEQIQTQQQMQQVQGVDMLQLPLEDEENISAISMNKYHRENQLLVHIIKRCMKQTTSRSYSAFAQCLQEAVHDFEFGNTAQPEWVEQILDTNNEYSDKVNRSHQSILDL